MQDTPTDISATIQRLATEALCHTPTPEQQQVIEAFASFATGRGRRDVLVVDGHAGTGKTSVIGALVTALCAVGRRPVMLAPTGRAAKVAANYASIPPSTIHKRIYRCTQDYQFILSPNTKADTIFIVDEASMVTHYRDKSLLADLITYVYSAPGCALVLVGDSAQLPPVGQDNSPALDPECLRILGLNPRRVAMKTPVRQSLRSGMLLNATLARRALFEATPLHLRCSRLRDVKVVEMAELADYITSSWSRVGQEATIFVTRSNSRANRFNAEIRNRVLQLEAPIAPGEKLILSKNNYFIARQSKEVDFLANGEIIDVEWVGKPHKMYGRFFVDIEFHTASNPGLTLGGKVMLRSLATDGPAIPTAEMMAMQNRLMEAFPGSLTQKMKALDDDPYYNALQVKYGYAVTCHKAQGGQWRHVYIDLAGIKPDILGYDPEADDITRPADPAFLRWLYTSLTRATDTIYLVNPPAPLLL